MHHGGAVDANVPSRLRGRRRLQKPLLGEFGKWNLHPVGVVEVLEDPFRIDATQLGPVGDGDGGFDMLVYVDDGSRVVVSSVASVNEPTTYIFPSVAVTAVMLTAIQSPAFTGRPLIEYEASGYHCHHAEAL